MPEILSSAAAFAPSFVISSIHEDFFLLSQSALWSAIWLRGSHTTHQVVPPPRKKEADCFIVFRTKV